MYLMINICSIYVFYKITSKLLLVTVIIGLLVDSAHTDRFLINIYNLEVRLGGPAPAQIYVHLDVSTFTVLSVLCESDACVTFLDCVN